MPPSRLIHVEDDGQQKSLGRFPPQLLYKLGQELESRRRNSDKLDAWLACREAIRTASRRPAFCLEMPADLAMMAVLPRKVYGKSWRYEDEQLCPMKSRWRTWKEDEMLRLIDRSS